MDESLTKNLQQYSFLITGGAGFIGSNLVEFLLAHGAKHVRVLDNLSNGFKKNIEPFMSLSNFEFIEGDIRNLETCKKACAAMDFVSHQAALGSVPRSIKDPIASNEVNVSGFLNMLIAAKDSGVSRFVYAASSSTYGDSTKLPKREDQIGLPISPYAVTKYANELYAHVFALNYGMSIIGLRYFNVFGPKQDPYGAYAAVIPLFMKAALTKMAPVINGEGKQSRDFTYVQNAVQANVKAIFAEIGQGHEVVNVACGEQTDLNQLWNMIQRISGDDLKPTYGPPRAGDIQDSLADLTKIKDLLGYMPEVTVEEGLKLTYDYFKSIFIEN